MTDAYVEVHKRYEAEAEAVHTTWLWIVDRYGSVSQTSLTQAELFNAVPEINPRFFVNFDISSLVLEQTNGTKIIIKRRGE